MTGHLVPLLFLAPLSLQNTAESHPPEPGRLGSEARGVGGGGGEWEGTHGGWGHSSLVEAEETLELEAVFPAFCRALHILEDGGPAGTTLY